METMDQMAERMGMELSSDEEEVPILFTPPPPLTPPPYALRSLPPPSLSGVWAPIERGLARQCFYIIDAVA